MFAGNRLLNFRNIKIAVCNLWISYISRVLKWTKIGSEGAQNGEDEQILKAFFWRMCRGLSFEGEVLAQIMLQ